MGMVSCQLSVVSCQWPVVGDSIASHCRLVRRVGGAVADRFQEVVELWAEFVEQRLESFYVRIGKKFATIRAAKEVLRFIERAARSANKSTIVSIAAATSSFCNVRAHAVSCPDQLLAKRVPGEEIPLHDQIPNSVSNNFGKLVDPQILKIGSYCANVERIRPAVEADTRLTTATDH